MRSWVLLFCYSSSFAVLHADAIAQNESKSLSYYESYLIFERQKKEFEGNREKLLKLRRKYLQKEKKRKSNQNKAYLLDFSNNVQIKGLKDSSVKLKGLSNSESAFFAHQKKQQNFEKQRKKTFSAYKKRYKEYKKQQKKILALRLKAIANLRDRKEDNRIPVF